MTIILPYTKHILFGLVQERRNSIANALELPLSCTNLLICPHEGRDKGIILGGPIS